MIILAGKKEEHLNMLEGGIVAKLMEEKWNTFAKMAFAKRLLLLCVQLFCISCAIYTRPPIDESLLTGIAPGTAPINNQHITRYCFEVSLVPAYILYDS